MPPKTHRHKTPTSFYLSAESHAALHDLSTHLGISRTAAVEAGVRLLAERLGLRPVPQRAAGREAPATPRKKIRKGVVT